MNTSVTVRCECGMRIHDSDYAANIHVKSEDHRVRMLAFQRYPVAPIGNYRKDTTELLRCPRCQVSLLPLGYPGALSRTDNATEICSGCGTLEGLEDWLSGGHAAQAKWPVRVL